MWLVQKEGAMQIRIPKERAYYAASANEPDWLLCWIPADELACLIAQGRIRPDVLELHPSGLEVEVSPQGLAQYGLDLGVPPEALRKVYVALRAQGRLPASGMAKAAGLESLAQEAASTAADASDALAVRPGDRLPEPQMTDGADARSVMQRL